MSTSGPRLYRILFEVGPIAEAVAFYARLLGAEGRPIWSTRHYFDCGDVILGLVDVSGAGREPRPSSEYVYFAVGDVDEVHARAEALGCLSSDDVHGTSGGVVAVRPWGERSFYVADPYGNRLCFVDDSTLYTG
jgi:catechol 2,3-dioxygenase-like lactoylglutathione lyase family enzyme